MTEKTGAKKRGASRGLILFLLFAGVATVGPEAESLHPALPVHYPPTQDVARTTLHGGDRPLRSDRGDFDPAMFAHRTPPPSPPSRILVPEHLDRVLTRYYIDRYTRPNGVAWLHSVIRNGHTYIPFVKSEIERLGLPPELVVVPFIESDYIGTAVSRSGATGIWQFMMNSIDPFGIRVNETLDERRDFRRSTVGALRKLEGHYRNFGCWAMAFAAYNMGPNGLRRAAQRAGTFDYWDLAARREISQETTRFVPRIVAAAYVLTNARRFGVDWWPEGVEWTTVRPGRPVSLDMIASETGTDRNLLRRLNLELLHGITPADPDREIVVPAARAQAIAALLERDDMVLVQYHRYRIQPGDTLYALSRHYGISVATIEMHNPGVRNRHLRPGETLVIPVLQEVEPFAREPVTFSRLFNGTHVVAQGDTLWSLARRYNVNPQELAMANNMDLNQTLSIGRALRVPIIIE
ncbi:MAG: LysM peptidoglycan-binding domain-containing protein [Treponema sp.]|nr:LysM peptidoglycan-binding domain-containing protein [Treponema sp.]